MKNPWNNMIPFLPLQEFMSLTFVQGKLRASAPCSIFLCPGSSYMLKKKIGLWVWLSTLT
ncbi:hypothetical protein BHE74_00020869 [Ensete ventricosum]|nr:hypothetical protein GW17_00037967 [Ensete ventricosum]RWW71394.1 hypothetical protein BHE74_00020869 [Ensete ventricosum]RZR98270.1 hypothetical protein BHM03_00027587 [Ensete ventricosum]